MQQVAVHLRLEHIEMPREPAPVEERCVVRKVGEIWRGEDDERARAAAVHGVGGLDERRLVLAQMAAPADARPLDVLFADKGTA